MTAYATRLANSIDTAARVRVAELLDMAPGASALSAAGGVRADGGGVVTVSAGTMTVNVSPFMALVPGGVSTVQGSYPFVSDSSVALTVSNGHATLARVDTVVARVRDNAFDASGFTDAAVVLITGTPGAGAPALPTNAVPLRDINVPAGTSTGTGGLSSSNLGADRRLYLNTAIGANEKALNRWIANAMSGINTTSYSVLPNSTERTACQMSFTKKRSDTKLVLDLRVHGFMLNIVGAGSWGAVGLRVNGTDVDMARAGTVLSGVGENDITMTLTGVKELTGVAAGTFTIEPVVKVNSTSVSFDATSSLSFTVREVPV